MTKFVVCPVCKRPVSEHDLDESFIEKYGNISQCDFLPMKCLHCGKSAYKTEWKEMIDPPKPKLTEDLFTI